MRVEVINTGTELLLGNVINTHGALFGQALFPLGLRVERQVTVPDGSAIRDALIEAFGRAEILLITGGLGPTTDDVTREVTAELLGLKLVVDDGILQAIHARCERRGFQFLERMGRQAMVPAGAEVLANAFGTAPGIYIPPQDMPSLRTPHVFLLPGPPRELRPMFDAEVLPRIQAACDRSSSVICRTYRCVGLGESMVEERIGLKLSSVAGLEVGYCARPNEVDFRLIGEATLVDALDAEVRAALGDAIVSDEGDSLETLVVGELIASGRTLVTAESCTGGLLANRITNVPGASAVFLQGWVTYANSAKRDLLGVSEEDLECHGAVSETVAGQMAENARVRADADFGLSTTGIAGPGGGTDEKPVGTVFMALAERNQSVRVWRECFPTDRETFKYVTTQAILNRLRLRLSGADASGS